MADEDEAFSVIGERLIHDGGGLLVVPQQWTLLDLYVSVAVKYPRCLSSSINSGLVSTMLSLLEGYTEIPKPYNKIRIPAHRIMSFLYLLTKQCTKDQIKELDTLGSFDIVRRIVESPYPTYAYSVAHDILALAADQSLRIGRKKRRLY
eukprot:Protomagalhaensia_wolfi_Nauph_80__1323@NODE_1790_length_1337_cov_58_231895_g1342_i1_p2_GENE_NODE_1790_length_1337_cov_58_231895_g1342_i1NODE_1790_length_1337_cov_58_231895_g1342_i1_p2_ORF_typecomplete_len170_score17_02_NODE_1790_length_1337_cov_58_231895_g1342_i165511